MRRANTCQPHNLFFNILYKSKLFKQNKTNTLDTVEETLYSTMCTRSVRTELQFDLCAQYGMAHQDNVFHSNPMQYQSKPCAPIMPHAQSLQVQLPDGIISGKMKQNLPPIINTKIGLQQLARYIHYSKEQMNNIDWPNYHIASKSLTSTALSRAHACKSFNNQWYTDAQAHKYNNELSPTCRCCQSIKSETIAHIIGCPSRAQTHDEFRPQVTAHFQACRIGDHLLNALELGIEMVLSDTESHRGETWRGNEEGSEIE